MRATTTLRFTEARTHLGEILNKAEYAFERTVIERRGRPSAAIVSLSDLRTLEDFDRGRRRAEEV